MTSLQPLDPDATDAEKAQRAKALADHYRRMGRPQPVEPDDDDDLPPGLRIIIK